MIRLSPIFFFNDTATTEIYTLSLHDALPILTASDLYQGDVLIEDERISTIGMSLSMEVDRTIDATGKYVLPRSEEHTSELQSRQYLVCRLLLEKKKHMPSSS